jgi:WD40 repeat protein
MSHIFISYSRKDLDFAQKIVDALAANNLNTWVDWKSIPYGEDWEQEIYGGIEGADAFLFLISPDSVVSQMCNKEIGHAVRNGKRILPIFISNMENKEVYGVTEKFLNKEAKEEINRRNFIFCREERDVFNDAIEEIQTTICTDYEWLKYHNQLQNKALAWEHAEKDKSRLLRGKELREAEEQLAGAGNQKDPQPTGLHRNYILASQRNEIRQRRQITIGLGFGLVIVAVLAIFAWKQRNGAIEQAKIARSGELAALSGQELTQRQDISLLLSAESFLTAPMRQAQGSLLAAVQSSPKFFLWNVDAGASNVAFSPNGKILVSNGANGINLWDVSSGAIIGQLNSKSSGKVSHLAFNPDGRLLAAADDQKQVVVWDISTRKPVGKPLRHPGLITTIAFSPDGKSLAVGGSMGIAIWDIETRKMLTQPLQGHSVNQLVFDPSGHKIAAINADRTLVIWEIASGKPRVLSENLGVLWAVAFSPDGKTLASSDTGGSIAIWDVQSGLKVSTLSGGHSGSVSSLIFHPSGRLLVSGSADGTLAFWDLSDQTRIYKTLRPAVGGVEHIALSLDGRTMAVGGYGSISLWEIDTTSLYPENQLISETLGRHIVAPLCAANSPNGELWAIKNTSGKLTLLNRSGDPLFEFETGQTEEVCGIAFHPDGQYLATGFDQNAILIWDISTYQLVGPALRGHTGPVLSVAYSPNGKILASGSTDGTVILWDATQGHALGEPLKGQIGPIYSLAFSPDSNTLAAGGEEAMVLWNLPSGQRGEIFNNYYDSVKSVAFSPNGLMLATGSDDFDVKFWPISGKPPTYTLPGHEYSVNSVTFSPDGKTLASAGDDEMIILWDVANGQRIGPALSGYHGSVQAIRFSVDGKTLFSVNADGSITEWLIDTQAIFDKACQIVGRNFTQAEWTQYFPGEEYRITCPQYPAGE